MLRRFLSAMGIALVLLGLVGLGLRTVVLLPPVLAFIEARVNGLKIGRLGRLQVSGARGDLWGRLTVGRFAIADQQGVWIAGRDVALQWRPSELLGRTFQADRLSAAEIRVLRRPVLGPREGPSRGMPVTVRIDAFQTRLVMEPAFSVRRGVYDVAGGLQLRRGKAGQAGRIEATSVLHPGDHLRARFDIGPKRPLKVDVEGLEARGGALAGALGLPADQTFALEIQADGRARAGRFHALARSGATQPLVADGFWGEQGGQADGRLSLLASSLTRPLADRLGPEAVIRIRGRRLQDKRYALVGQARSTWLDVAASGQLEADMRTTAGRGLALDVRAPDLQRLLGSEALGGGVRLSGLLKGDPGVFDFAGQLEGARLRQGDYSLNRVAGPVSLRRRNEALDLEVALSGTGGGGTGLARALLGPTPRAALKAARLKDGRLLIRQFTAAGEGLKVAAEGGRTLLGGLDFQGSAEAANLAAWRTQAHGGMGLRWSARQGRGGGPWSLELDASGRDLQSGLDELDRLLGRTPTLAARGKFANGALELADLQLKGAALSARSAGRIGPRGLLDLTLDWSATGPFRAGPIEISGRGSGKGTVTGDLGAPRASLVSRLESVALPDLVLRDADLALTFARGPDGSAGDVELRAQSDYGPAYARSDFAFVPSGVRLSGLKVDAAGLSASGAVSLVDGAPSSADLQVLVERGLFLEDGRIQGAVELTGDPASAQARLDLSAQDAVLKGSVLAIRSASLTAQGPLRQLPYRLEASGSSRAGRWRIAGAGYLAREKAATALSFQGGGRVGRRELSTSEPARFTSVGDVRTASLALTSKDGGAVELSARLSPDQTSVNAGLKALDLALFNEDLAGRIDGDLNLSGDGGPLAGGLEARLLDARGRGTPESAGVDADLSARLEGAQLRIAAESSNDGGLKAKANLTLPVVTATTPLRLAIDRTRPMSGDFFADGQIRPLWDLLMDSNRKVGGLVHAEGTIAGSINSPRLTGWARMQEGRLEDAATGLVLGDLQVRTQFSEDRIDVTEVSGTDGRRGRVSGGGVINLDQAGASSFRMDLQGFRLIDNELVEATASGRVTMDRGQDGRIRMSGALEVNEAEVSAEATAPPGVVTIDVIERNKPREIQASLPAPRSAGPGVALDVTLKAPRRIFVRGRGLDLELSLDAHVRGTTSRPVLDGAARVVRGDYDFAGKRFEFDTRSVVYLASSAEAVRLDLTATRADPSLTAVVRVTGTAAKPVVTLSSSPALPSDEVLSQVLFGVSASQLSPLEAAQLASALSALAGGGGFDVVGNLRSFAGLDRLALAGGGQSAVSVSGGKYLTDDVYLEITGGGRDGASAQVEWRVRPNLSIISRLAGQGDGKLAIRWRKDD